VLVVEQLNQFYGESHTLWDLDLHIAKGSCACLMGRNGVGKTTLLKTIMGLLPARSGSICLDGTLLNRKATEQRVRLGIGYVPQGREIFPLLSVEENLLLAAISGRAKWRRVPDFIYELFPVLREMRHRRGGDLSGGQQQQLAIGRALALDPKLLILDEPTEGIQPNIVAEIGHVIRRLNADHGITVLLVEQKIPFARRVADEFIMLERGAVVARGTMAELTDPLIRAHLSV
jgi:urea transport system ATP-binding protein